MEISTRQDRQKRVHDLRDLFFTMIWMGHRQMVQHLQSYDLTHPQFITLASLIAHDQPASMRELSDVTFQDAPSMTRIVDRLVKMGWVRRTRDENDRRVVLVEGTETGRALINQIECEHHEDDSHGFNGMSDQDVNKMEDLMDHILGVYLKKTNRTAGDLESTKQSLQQFANDPIGYLKMHKESE